MTETDKLADFKMALSQFVEDVCGKLLETGIAIQRWVRIVHEEKEWSFPEEERPDYSGTSFLIMREFREEPPDSLQQAVDIAREVPELASTMLVDADGNPIHGLWWMDKFIHDYLEKAKTVKFDEQSFNTVFDRLRQEIESPNITVKELSPLMNASLNCESITIAPYLVIRKLTTDELERWLNNYIKYPHFPGSPAADIMQLDCAMELTYEKKRHEAWGSNQDIINSASDLVTTLRLLTDKNIYTAFTKRVTDSISQPSGGTSSSLKPRLFGLKAEISASLGQDIIDTWNRIQSLVNGSPIRLALRRWNTVFERFDPDDALIDYWIALEGLFVHDSFQEIRYRSSFRIGAWLGQTPDEREKIYKDLLESYKLRSKIVHGGVPNTIKRTELINTTRSYLRRALVQILSSTDTFDPKTIEIERLRK